MHPSVSTLPTSKPTSGITRTSSSATYLPTNPLANQPTNKIPSVPPTTVHSQTEYDRNKDFADWDDFFESPDLHDLRDIIEDYSIIISYAGSRFYGTIIQSNETVDDVFPPDYHAFWSQ